MKYIHRSNEDYTKDTGFVKLFTEESNRESVKHYGCTETVVFPTTHTTADEIIEKYGEMIDVHFDGYSDIIDPDDIVNSAGAWDDGDFVCWFCENIAIENDINAIKTYDGLVIFSIENFDGKVEVN